VRDAAEGRFRIRVDHGGMGELHGALHRASRRRDTAIAAGFLWLSGLLWVALSNRYPWFGWAQMVAALALSARYRS
jgi:hypothetical protein